MNRIDAQLAKVAIMTTSLKYSDLQPGKPTKISLGDKEVCVVRVNEEVFAVADICSHAEARFPRVKLVAKKSNAGFMAPNLI